VITVCFALSKQKFDNINFRRNFIEIRNGMINISPMVRSCTQSERDEFYEWDKIHHCRDKIIASIHYHIRNQNLYVDLNFLTCYLRISSHPVPKN
jgi:hypothetical protein